MEEPRFFLHLATASNRDRAVDLVFEGLGIGEYDFTIDPQTLRDLASNPIGGPANRSQLRRGAPRPRASFANALSSALVDVASYRFAVRKHKPIDATSSNF